MNGADTLFASGSETLSADFVWAVSFVDHSGALFAGGLPTSLSLDDLDGAVFTQTQLVGLTRVSTSRPIEFLATVPEPATGALLAVGLLVLGLRGRRRG